MNKVKAENQRESHKNPLARPARWRPYACRVSGYSFITGWQRKSNLLYMMLYHNW